jgi:hypothetical protein
MRIANLRVAMIDQASGYLVPRLAVNNIDPTRSRKGNNRKNEQEQSGDRRNPPKGEANRLRLDVTCQRELLSDGLVAAFG